MIGKLVIPPELGEDIEVRLLLWSKIEGDAVAIGDALLEFETDKAIVLVSATQSGTLRRCFFAAGDWMKPGNVAAWLSTDPDEPLPAAQDAEAEALLVTFEVT
jgi:pyruvate/2-oxoglutarate dehydrogenase complex dihydrolipoamide acyltransferase (E2) component